MTSDDPLARLADVQSRGEAALLSNDPDRIAEWERQVSRAERDTRRVSVPAQLLRDAAKLVVCEQDGQWCDVHDDQVWPCPLVRLMEYVPTTCGESVEDKFSRATCVLDYGHDGDEHEAADGWRWES